MSLARDHYFFSTIHILSCVAMVKTVHPPILCCMPFIMIKWLVVVVAWCCQLTSHNQAKTSYAIQRVDSSFGSFSCSSLSMQLFLHVMVLRKENRRSNNGIKCKLSRMNMWRAHAETIISYKLFAHRAKARNRKPVQNDYLRCIPNVIISILSRIYGYLPL